MNANNYLFVGGPKDGQWDKITEPHMHLKVMTKHEPKTASFLESLPSPEDAAFIEHGYKLIQFMSGETKHWVYFHDSIHSDDMMGIILNGYRKPRA